MDEKKELAKQDYEKGMKYKDIAEKYGVTLNTVKSWKTRYKWSRNSVHTQGKGVHSKKKGGQPGNKNAVGHGPPKENQNAKTHGLFSKFLPAETLEITKSLNERSPADLLWDQILIQYAAIIRAQQIMFVTDKNEVIKELKKEKKRITDNEESSELEYEFQFAWDRQATFLTAQSRAMAELRNLIKQFNDLAHEDDERRLKLEQIQLNIAKTKAEIKEITNDNDSDDRTIIVNDIDEMKAVIDERNQDN